MRIDMHVHTSHSHDCRMDAREVLEMARRAGLDGVAITDHNKISGALEARDLADGVKVIVGEEILTKQGEVIGYGLKERIGPGQDISRTIDIIKEQGGLVCLPHPFDSMRSSAISDEDVIKSILDRVDFLEINARTFPKQNRKAERMAIENGIRLTGGSDAHTPGEIGKAFTIFRDGLEGSSEIVNNSGLAHSLSRLARTKLYKTLRI